ncbi:DUF4856 domain-containing protein [Flavicella sediminum]|uniref:DUF4856 domain-containing protein n=1 Tax=Flavicella sediminum TaxID=2585141 RepID=UPI001FB7B587|nr:DUF4856 domain-containing protein [Flavicella sediminum]
MKSINFTTGVIVAISSMFVACDNGEDLQDIINKVEDIETGFTVPSTYNFTRGGNTTVSFSGQTTRLSMAKEVLNYLAVDSGKSAQEIEAAFAHTTGANDFTDTDLNASDKSVKSKVAASDDLFGEDAVTKGAIQADFSEYISNQVSEVVPNKDVEATAGTAGYIGSKPRYVNGKGIEYNQVFNKGMIGALVMDQVLNNYLGNIRVSNEDYISKNNAETLEEGKNYTKYEHHFDEAYGYVYGDATVDSESPIDRAGDKFLFSYITQVNADTDFEGIQNQIFKAFVLGRAAVVANEYEVLNKAIDVLQYQISKVVAVRAVHYFQAGKVSLAADDYESAFHALSEGYGFLYSLQFSRNPVTDAPYFTFEEVTTLLDKLEAGNGFWDLKDGTVLDEVSNAISAKFDFTTAQAAN